MDFPESFFLKSDIEIPLVGWIGFRSLRVCLINAERDGILIA